MLRQRIALLEGRQERFLHAGIHHIRTSRVIIRPFPAQAYQKHGVFVIQPLEKKLPLHRWYRPFLLRFV